MPSTASKQIVLILFLLNASAFTVTAVAGDALDINPTIGDDTELEEADESARNIQSSQTSISTLFGSIMSALGIVTTIFDVVFYGPNMLVQLGVPSEIMTIAKAGSSIIVGTDLLYLITGRQL